MKIKFSLLIFLISFIGFSQSVNDYKAVIVPIKFDFARGENPYRIATVTKSNFIKAGFTAFYENEQLPVGYTDRCDVLYANVKKEPGFFMIKLFIELKDCSGKVIFTSEMGKSQIKEYDLVYIKCVDLAFVSINKLHYKYNGKAGSSNAKMESEIVTPVAATVLLPIANITDPNLLYAQPTENGFQLIDKTSKEVMKLVKTSRSDLYIATKDGLQGTLNAKENQWFFEYYKGDKLFSEKISVKF
ncbi:MAG TPA: hypothetical protein VIV55_05745 [Flavobacterium sp.]